MCVHIIGLGCCCFFFKPMLVIQKWYISHFDSSVYTELKNKKYNKIKTFLKEVKITIILQRCWSFFTTQLNRKNLIVIFFDEIVRIRRCDMAALNQWLKNCQEESCL